MKTIPLNHGKVALVDDEDFERLSLYKWTAVLSSGIWYAVRCRRGIQKNYIVQQTLLQMHREVLRLTPSDPLVDHKNRDGLDNQKHNLRRANRSINAQNRRRGTGTSAFLGVCWVTRSRRWMAQIKYDGKNRYLGEYPSEEEAARVYDAAALKGFGPDARTNFPKCAI